MLTIITPPSAEPVTLAEAMPQTRASAAEKSFLLLCIKGVRAALRVVEHAPAIK